jgi:carboxymethylenebutenolidase
MDQRIINLFDEFTHKPLPREEFIKRLTRLTGSTAAAMTVLPLLEVNYANAQTVQEADPRLKTERIEYPGEGMTMKGYLARPSKKGKYPCVMVIHENRGLNPHIEDVTRRVALEGFIAMAPDVLSGQGGTPADTDKAREMFQKLDAAQSEKCFARGFDYFTTRKDAKPSWGCVGFCWGGAMTNRMAVVVPGLKAAVPYYGRQPEAADVPRINAALMLHYAGMDERINAGIAAYEEALKANGKKYQIFVYEGAQHAFNNDTAPTRYNAEVAKIAWDRTIAFFKEQLG